MFMMFPKVDIQAIIMLLTLETFTVCSAHSTHSDMQAALQSESCAKEAAVVVSLTSVAGQLNFRTVCLCG